MSGPTVPAASFPVPFPALGVPAVDPKTGMWTPSGYNLMTRICAAISGAGGLGPAMDGIWGADLTEGPTGAALVISSRGVPFAASAFTLPELTLVMPKQFSVSGSPWEQDGTVTVTTAAAKTVMTLPASPAAGDRNFVSDSTVAAATNFGAIVAGTGTYPVPVYYDGTNWRIG